MRTEKASQPDAPQRVTLLYRGARLGAELLALLGEERLVNVISSPTELAKGGPPADVVVVDVPAQDRRAVCEQVRRQYHGPLIVLLSLGDNSRDLPPDHSRVLLTRPFSMRDLSVALAGSRPAPPTLDPVGRLRLVPPPHGAQDRGRPDRVVPAVPRPERRWRDRRMLRVSVIAIAAALAFTGAFALITRSTGCGPGCDELTGADVTAPSSAGFPAVPIGPYTTAAGVSTVTSTTTRSSAGPVAGGGLLTDAPTGGAAPIAPTTAGGSGAPGPTAPPDPTRPQTSAPPSTAPKSTTTRASTTTTTTTSTTTTTTTTVPTGP
jgi:hypothetical protein